MLLLYLILYHHQTTTLIHHYYFDDGCILSYIIIKPQPIAMQRFLEKRCILSYIIIKPQLGGSHLFSLLVVSYLISSSNHN